MKHYCLILSHGKAVEVEEQKNRNKALQKAHEIAMRLNRIHVAVCIEVFNDRTNKTSYLSPEGVELLTPIFF